MQAAGGGFHALLGLVGREEGVTLTLRLVAGSLGFGLALGDEILLEGHQRVLDLGLGHLGLAAAEGVLEGAGDHGRVHLRADALEAGGHVHADGVGELLLRGFQEVVGRGRSGGRRRGGLRAQAGGGRGEHGNGGEEGNGRFHKKGRRRGSAGFTGAGAVSKTSRGNFRLSASGKVLRKGAPTHPNPFSPHLFMDLSIIGSGYVGLVSGACFAEVGHNVICVDNDQRKVDALQAGKVPIYEAGTGRPDPPQRQRRPFAVHQLHRADGVDHSEVVFIAVPTPPQADGSVDLSYIERVAREIAGVLKPGQYRVVVDKSTVPVKTGDKVAETIRRYGAAARSSTSFPTPSSYARAARWTT